MNDWFENQICQSNQYLIHFTPGNNALVILRPVHSHLILFVLQVILHVMLCSLYSIFPSAFLWPFGSRQLKSWQVAVSTVVLAATLNSITVTPFVWWGEEIASCKMKPCDAPKPQTSLWAVKFPVTCGLTKPLYTSHFQSTEPISF